VGESISETFMGKDVNMTNFKVILQHSPAGNEGDHEKISE
jgi:hypothetical protein